MLPTGPTDLSAAPLPVVLSVASLDLSLFFSRLFFSSSGLALFGVHTRSRDLFIPSFISSSLFHHHLFSFTLLLAHITITSSRSPPFTNLHPVTFEKGQQEGGLRQGEDHGARAVACIKLLIENSDTKRDCVYSLSFVLLMKISSSVSFPVSITVSFSISITVVVTVSV